MKQDTGSFHTH